MQTPEGSFLHKGDLQLPHTAVSGEPAAEYLRSSGVHAPNRLVDMGGVAVAAAERPRTPEVDVQQLESERKINTTENLRALKKRFGERFVRGEKLEGGGYTGGAARELLAGFMDRPGFADELKRLIPNRHGALQLLKDNHSYIQATLDQFYQDDPGHERQPAKDPYELARSVGYELTGPFESTGDFVSLDRQDFRPSERLCTFNEPTERLKDYYILWLRHADVSNTLPADQLTQDTLSDAWKTYLKTIGRYDRDTDSYDLSGLRPTRDDPYGISSMSVQISRTGRHVSIKNRYNHTVGNPDDTLDSDLDNVAYGLRQAVYSLVGRADLMDRASVALAEGYIIDNDGGIHAYRYEEDNVYYGDYEYINNGVVTTIDRGKYYMISPQLYVPRSGKGDELRLGQRATGSTGFEVTRDIRFLYNSSAKSNKKDPRLGELRRTYAERDRSELTQAIREALTEQATAGYQGYLEVAQTTGAEVANEQEFGQLFEAKMSEWQTSGIMDYLARDLIENGNKPNLLATPNVVADWQTLSAFATKFGEDQPYKTYIDEELSGQYSPEELSGQPTAGLLRFSIMPSGYTKQLGQRPAEAQLATLQQLQAEQPNLNMRVPSVFEAITYWRTLRARGDALADDSAFGKTYIRHFNLDAKRFDTWPVVPLLYVRGDGLPYLVYSHAGGDCSTRVLVG